MEKVAVVFTVFFEEPFWCGVYQRQEGRNLEAARMVFGAEPKEYEVLAFLLQNWKQLRFGSTDSAPCAVERKNPKRMQREAGKQTKEKGVGTKAQQALAARPQVNASTLVEEYPNDFTGIIGLHTYSQSPHREYDITMTGNWVERGGFRFQDFVLTRRKEVNTDGNH